MEWDDSIFLGVIIIVIGIILFFVANEIQWAKAPITEKSCHLISQNYTASTLQTNVVPIFTGKGMAAAVTTTGNPETKTTIWDCGNLGKLTTDKEDVFRWAKEDSILLIKIKNKSYRIKGIKN